MQVVRRSAAPTRVLPDGNRQWIGHGDRLMLVQAEIGGGPFAKPNPPHSHPHEQIGYVVEGELNVFIGSEQARVGPGDFWVIPGGMQHTVQLLTKTARLVECFSPIREDFLKP
jgi:mannose-6-phosphate isomerase-like protein (cupin superfamily)